MLACVDRARVNAVQHYRSKDWAEFRDKFIELHNAKCSQCGRSRDADGVILQVHHLEYRAGHKPWEYGYDELEVLCRKCHAVEHGIIMPGDGWTIIGEEDLGSVDGICDKCGTHFRHKYLVDHPKWCPIEVGTICCDNLTGTIEASEYENHLRKLQRRKMAFVNSKKWGIGPFGGVARVVGVAYWEIKAVGANWVIYCNTRRGDMSFPSVEKAKMHIFDIQENGRAASYIARKYRLTEVAR